MAISHSLVSFKISLISPRVWIGLIISYEPGRLIFRLRKQKISLFLTVLHDTSLYCHRCHWRHWAKPSYAGMLLLNRSIDEMKAN